jgi:sterol desaturase/sphingolipid hydroxylase (fatty acid hydroxylase superfamily)
MRSFAAALAFGIFNMAWIFIVLWGVERLWPKDRPPERVQLASLRFWAFYAVAGALIIAAFGVTTRALNLQPLVAIKIEDHVPLWAAYILGPLATLATYDFFNYWMHRAQHKWFWRQHAIHHSIEHLSGVNSYFHWTEQLFRVAFISVPSAVLFDLHIGGVTLVSTMIVAGYGNFIHSASTIHFGKVGRLFLADPRWHRIHHSIEVTHFDKNFGTGITLWDRLFGTAYFPENHEWPASGVPDQPEVRTVRDFLWRPFRRGLIADHAIDLATRKIPAP